MNSAERNTMQLRRYLRTVAKRRPVTADDVHTFIRKNEWNPRPSKVISLVNRAFSEGFRPTGRVPSSRPEAKGRSITAYVAR